MNRKGDVPVTILVIGVFVVCMLAMFIFFISSLQTSSDFVNVGLIEKVSSRMEQGDAADGIEERGNKTVSYLEEKKTVKPWFEDEKDIFYVRYYK